jgi:hypothetical protein
MPMIEMDRASPLFGVQRFRRFTDETLQGPREELLLQAILKPYDPSCVEYEAENGENVNPQLARVKGEVIPAVFQREQRS